MCSKHDPLYRFEKLQMGMIYHGKRLEPRVLHGYNIVGVILFLLYMYIFGAKFEELCPNVSGDILDLVFYCFKCT